MKLFVHEKGTPKAVKDLYNILFDQFNLPKLSLLGRGRDCIVFSVSSSEGDKRSHLIIKAPLQGKIASKEAKKALTLLGRESILLGLNRKDAFFLDAKSKTKTIRTLKQTLNEKRALRDQLLTTLITAKRDNANTSILFNHFAKILRDIDTLHEEIESATVKRDMSLINAEYRRRAGERLQDIIELEFEIPRPEYIFIEPGMGLTLMNSTYEHLALTAEQALHVGLKNIQNLNALHQGGYIHGDISPGNAATGGLIDIDGLKDGTDSNDAHCGSPGFVSPQSMYLGKSNNATLTKENDIYCLGMVLHDLFEANGLFESIPNALDFFMQMTAFNPNNRPNSDEVLSKWQLLCKEHGLTELEAPIADNRMQSSCIKESIKLRHIFVTLYRDLSVDFDAEDIPTEPFCTFDGASAHLRFLTEKAQEASLPQKLADVLALQFKRCEKILTQWEIHHRQQKTECGILQVN